MPEQAGGKIGIGLQAVLGMPGILIAGIGLLAEQRSELFRENCD
jgi:hypothetical protein